MRALLSDGRVHLFDGAMGTLLYARGVFVNVCYDALNLEQPDLVRSIHRDYAAAGAEILETNTFGANPVKLSAYGLDGETEALNAAAVTLAREAAGPGVRVAGAMGPLGIRVEPWGPTSLEEATQHFRRQVQGLLQGGVDGFVLETFSDLAEIQCAIRAVRELSDLPVVAQMTVDRDGATAVGTEARHIAPALEAAGADAVGFNCSVGPAIMLEALEDMAPTTSLPLSAQPNAGLPRTVGDRKIYLASPEYLARYARRMIGVGARFVGGCCGTGPEHIRALRGVVAEVQPRHVTVRVLEPRAERARIAARPLEGRSALGRKLARGQPVATVEILPPHGWDRRRLLEPARKLKVAGVDAVNIVESGRGRSRMAAVPAALIVEREVGIETVVHYTCRDKNMPGMISDLLGAAAAGLHNLLLVSGDPPELGPYADATAVFDIDSIGLTNVVHGLNRGLDPGGEEIGEPTEFVVGVAANQGAVDQERERRRFAYKVEAGADFAVTQPVFDAGDLERFLDAVQAWRIPVIAGIWPLLNLRDAEFLANEMPGVSVPERVVARMRVAQEKGDDAALEEGVVIALEAVESVRGWVQGFHISAPRGRVDLAMRVLRESGLRATA
ncbi:MAG: bifunctional homocysteine S-methyltransferase/methylenetetrahydrofolate reductase [Gemmatimonadota bacterium]